jgi:PKD repeat protein
MKTFLLRSLLLLGAFFCLHNSSLAQPYEKIEQDIKYPCDTLSQGGGTGESCVHVCLGDTVKYSTVLQGTYKWDLIGDGTILSGAGTNEITVVWNSPGQYFVVVTVTGSDGQPISLHLCVIVEPDVTAVIGFDPNLTIFNGCIKICNNTAVTFDSNASFANIVSADWDFGDGFTASTNGGVVTHTYTTPGTYTVVLTAHSACCSDTAMYCVIVDSLSGPDIYCISPVCGGTEAVQYCTNAVCSTYSWTINGGAIPGATNQNCVTVDWGAGPVGTLSLATTNCVPATCPVATVATIPIMPNGTFNIGGPIVACIGSTNTYSAPYIPGAQYTWTFTEPCSNTTTILPYSSPPYLQNLLFPCAGTYVLQCNMTNDVLECEGDATLTITVVDDFTISGPDSLCENSAGTFSALQNFLPFNCNWTTLPNVGTVSNSPNASFNFTAAGTYVITAVPAVANTSCVPSQSITVVVLPAPLQATISPNPLVCPATPYSYTASGSGPGVTYNWTSTGGITFNSPTANPVSATIPGVFSSGTITVTPVSSIGCPGLPTTIPVTGYATPTPSITGPSTSCPDTNMTYNISLTYPGSSAVNITINPSNAGVIVSQTATTVVIKWFVISPSQATITITETICGNLTGSFTTPIINILPIPIITAAATSGCNGVNTTLSGTGGVTYNWFLASGTSLGSGNPFSTPYVAPGNYYVVATAANGCKAIAYTQAATYPEPTVSITGPTSAACDPATGLFSPAVTLTTPNGPYTFLWSNGSTSYTTSVTNPGTYTVTVTTSNGCIKTQTHTVNCACSSPCPTCIDGGVCDGNGNLVSTQTLTAPAGNSYLWSPGNQTTQTISTNIPGLYSVVVTDNSNVACPQTGYSFYLHCTNDVCPYSGINTCTASTPTFTQGNPNCNNFTFQTNTTCPGTASWNFGDGSLGASGNTVTHNYSQIGTYQVCYGFTGTPPCTPGPSACTTITVPVAANFSTLINCNTVTFTDLSTFISGSISGYLWNFGDPNNTTSTAANPTFTYLNGGTYNVTLTVTVGTCQAQITIPVTVVGPSITASISTSACNAPIAFTATDNGSNPPVVSWNWNFGDATNSTLQNPTHTFPPPGPLSYNVTVTATSGAGCTTTATGTVNITPPPPPFNLIFNSPACGSDLLDAGSGYTSYQWYMSGTAISGETNQTYLATASGNYYCIVTDANGCIIQSNTAASIINPLPVLNVTASPQPLCSNQAITLNSGLTGNYTVKWKDLSNNLLNTGFTYAPGILPAGTYTYNILAKENTTNCGDSVLFTFTVEPAPTVTISNSDPAGICAPNPVTLTATGLPASVTYLWSTGSVVPVISVYSGGSYTVTVTDPANGCTASATDNVIIFPMPDLSMLPIGCDSGCINPLADTINGPPGMSIYDWQINNVTVSTLQDLGLNNINMPVYGVPYTIKLIATTVNGCMDSTTFQYTPRECDTSDCYTMTDTIWCNSDGTWSFQFMVQNNNITQSLSIFLGNFTYPFMVNNLSYYYQFLNIAPGGNSGWVPATPLILSALPNQQIPSTFCFNTTIIYPDTCCYDSLCIELPDCDPCANIDVVSNADSTGCCQDVTLINNFTGNYFTGIQVIPVTPGATIASTQLGGPYTGTWTGFGNQSLMNFQPQVGNIPQGTLTNLFNLCLSLQPNTPNPQKVAINWMVATAEGDSVVCSDTLIFHCDPPVLNPCGEIHDTIICLGDGSYQYTFTLVNNSPYPVPMAAIDMLTPFGANFPNLVFFYNPVIAPGDSATQTFTFTPSLPAGSEICYHITLLDSIGCCCHAIDTVCFTLPECDTTCACGDWELFSVDLSPTDPTVQIPLTGVQCGATMPNVYQGSTVSFYAGGYSCIGDSACASTITWSIPGATPSSGTGLPFFNLNNPGTYTLTIYGSCGNTECDSCTFNFTVDADCNCGSWVDFEGTASWQPNPAVLEILPLVQLHCGSVVDNLDPNATISFSSGGYLCNGNDATCASQISWTVTGGATPSSGTGLPSFTLNGTGTYVLTVYGYCGGNICDSCQYTFVTAPELCGCGDWQTFGVTTSNVSYIDQPCGGTYSSKRGFPIQVNGAYDCTGGTDCGATYAWSITFNNAPYLTGTSLPINFTPAINGTYVVTITSYCNGQSCGSCTFTFKVKSPNPEPPMLSPGLSNQGNDLPENVSLKATPNPAKDVITLRIAASAPEKGIIGWYDELGIARKQLYTEWDGRETDIEMNVSDLAEGIYFVRFNGTTGSGFVKVMIFR